MEIIQRALRIRDLTVTSKKLTVFCATNLEIKKIPLSFDEQLTKWLHTEVQTLPHILEVCGSNLDHMTVPGDFGVSAKRKGVKSCWGNPPDYVDQLGHYG